MRTQAARAFWSRFLDWPLVAKMLALLVIASLLPLGVAAIIDIRAARQRYFIDASALLAARADQLAMQLDDFNREHQRWADNLARLPKVLEALQHPPSAADQKHLQEIFARYEANDPALHGFAIVDSNGTVVSASNLALVTLNLSNHPFVPAGLRGASVISDLFLAEPKPDDAPTIAYAAPVRASDGQVMGLTVLWVRAQALWALVDRSAGLAGRGSFAAVFDRHGIRIAYTLRREMVFHPAGPLDRVTLEALVQEHRFGAQTRQLLGAIQAFPAEFNRSRSPTIDESFFGGMTPLNHTWVYGTGRRLATAPWTIFYMLPESTIDGAIASLRNTNIMLTGAFMIFALSAGILFATSIILNPVRALTRATEAFAAGDFAERLSANRKDELGQLTTGFNSMAEQTERPHRGAPARRGYLSRLIGVRARRDRNRGQERTHYPGQYANRKTVRLLTRGVGRQHDRQVGAGAVSGTPPTAPAGLFRRSKGARHGFRAGTLRIA